MMPLNKVILTILVMALVTYFTRAFPFLFFSRRKPPEILDFIKDSIPPAVMTVLVLYCFKDIDWTSAPHGLPELLAALFVALVQLWKHNALLSIGGGTIFYMVLSRSDFLTRIFG